MTKDPAGAVFAALADPTRRRVVHELSKDGPLTATELARRIPVSRQAIAKHFDSLEEAGLAARPDAGREACILEGREVLRDRLTRDRDPLRELGRGQRSVFRELVHHTPTCRVGECIEDRAGGILGHAASRYSLSSWSSCAQPSSFPFCDCCSI